MEDKQKFNPDNRLRLMDQIRQVLRYPQYAYRTEQSYCQWIMMFIKFHGSKTHPKDVGKKEIEAFLGIPDIQGKVSVSTYRLGVLF